MATALLILAQAGENTQEADPGVDPFLIAGTVIAIAVAFGILWMVFTRASRHSRDGAESAPASRDAGQPPLEGGARHADAERGRTAGRSHSRRRTGDRDRHRDPAA